jgi:prepilin-type processing-associated H-X9-DG protein
MLAYPPGWGGSVTDSIAQQQIAASSGDRGDTSTEAPELTIGFTDQWMEMKTSQIDDPSWFVVCGDAARHAASINSPESLFYSACGANYFQPESSCASADWAGCSFTQSCGLDPSAVDEWGGDASFRSQFTRHLGGANVGFADGHASWWHADAFMANSPYCECCSDETGYGGSTIHAEDRKLKGLCPVP